MAEQPGQVASGRLDHVVDIGVELSADQPPPHHVGHRVDEEAHATIAHPLCAGVAAPGVERAGDVAANPGEGVWDQCLAAQLLEHVEDDALEWCSRPEVLVQLQVAGP